MSLRLTSTFPRVVRAFIHPRCAYASPSACTLIPTVSIPRVRSLNEHASTSQSHAAFSTTPTIVDDATAVDKSQSTSQPSQKKKNTPNLSPIAQGSLGKFPIPLKEGAFEIIAPAALTTTPLGNASYTRMLFTCEHASNELPEGYQWKEHDRRLKDTHWAYDIGAAELTRELCEHFHSFGLLSNYSRLFIDVNREIESNTSIRERTDTMEIEMNTNVSVAEKQNRFMISYDSFHTALHGVMAYFSIQLGIAIHSFTPVYYGQARSIEVGVLYAHDDDEGLARHLYYQFRAAGFKTGLNEPYSGKDGFMHCIDQARMHPLDSSNAIDKTDVEKFFQKDGNFTMDFLNNFKDDELDLPDSNDYLEHMNNPKQLLKDSDWERLAGDGRLPNTLMLEFRQDLILNEEWRKKVIKVLSDSLRARNLVP